MTSYLEKAIDIIGGQTAASEKLGVPQPTVRYWMKVSKKGAPAEHCPKIEELSGIPREKLRPDIDWGRA